MDRGRVIGLISGKGGVGKTSIGVNLAISLQKFGNEVTLVDADFSASNLGVYLGRYDHPVKIQNVLEGDSEAETAIFRHPTGIRAMVSSNEINRVEPDTANLRETFMSAAKNSDYVIVDCPPGLNSTVETIMASMDELVIVTMPTQTAGINAAQIIEKAKELQVPVLGTVVNKIDDDPEMELVDREIEMMTESRILTQIPYDKTMKKSLFENSPLLEHEPLSPAALKIEELAATIDGQNYEPPAFPNLKRKLKQIKSSFN